MPYTKNIMGTVPVALATTVLSLVCRCHTLTVAVVPLRAIPATKNEEFEAETTASTCNTDEKSEPKSIVPTPFVIEKLVP